MLYTVSLKENRDFRRLYGSKTNVVNPYMAVYCRKNKLGMNRLGLTVGTKVGHAVVRNRVRRRLREAYRMQEAGILKGYDIVIVARVRAAGAAYQALYSSLADSLVRLKLMQR
ncbi:MAG: ribonuclease P protein component [Clostridia bacterium]|nr:ribonuclease P protein component [Clostridia bacterium]